MTIDQIEEQKDFALNESQHLIPQTELDQIVPNGKRSSKYTLSPSPQLIQAPDDIMPYHMQQTDLNNLEFGVKLRSIAEAENESIQTGLMKGVSRLTKSSILQSPYNLTKQEQTRVATNPALYGRPSLNNLKTAQRIDLSHLASAQEVRLKKDH